MIFGELGAGFTDRGYESSGQYPAAAGEIMVDMSVRDHYRSYHYYQWVTLYIGRIKYERLL